MNQSDISRLANAGKREVASWTVKLGRFGLAARGAVYLTVGVLAAKAGAGLGGKATDQQGALEALGQSPLGVTALWVVGLGLAAYAAWRLIQALLDPDGHGTDAKGLVKRAAAFASGVAYAGLSVTSLAMARGTEASRGGEQATQDRTAWLMSQPFGRWLVGAVGVVIAAVALYQFKQAITCSFSKHLVGGGLSPSQELWSQRAGRIGHAARGVAFCIDCLVLLSGSLANGRRRGRGVRHRTQDARQPASWSMAAWRLRRRIGPFWHLFVRRGALSADRLKGLLPR